MTGRPSNYDKFPVIAVDAPPDSAWSGWQAVAQRIGSEISRGAKRIAIECYPGVAEDAILLALDSVFRPCLYRSNLRPLERFRRDDRLIAHDLTDDPVFGRMNGFIIDDFDRSRRLAASHAEVQRHRDSLTLGDRNWYQACCFRSPQVLIYADLPRWEIQKRQRSGKIGNLAAGNEQATAAENTSARTSSTGVSPIASRRPLLGRLDYLLDTTDPAEPSLVTGDLFRAALRHAVSRPFRVVPFFDPGPWGGQWMRDICGLDQQVAELRMVF